MSRAAIVLCGGHSRRMGRDKATLPFGDETLLERVVRIVSGHVDEVKVVARAGQGVEADARDDGRGPLAGIAAGLAAIESEYAFVTGCDAPFLQPEFIAYLFAQAEGRDAAVPLVDGYHMVLSAVYARRVLPVAERLLAGDRRRPLFLVQEIDANIVSADGFSESLIDCNTPEAYAAALDLYTRRQ